MSRQNHGSKTVESWLKSLEKQGWTIEFDGTNFQCTCKAGTKTWPISGDTSMNSTASSDFKRLRDEHRREHGVE